MNKIKSIIAGSMIGLAGIVANAQSTNDGSQLLISQVTYRGAPSIDITATNVVPGYWYNVFWNTNGLNSTNWIQDNQNLGIDTNQVPAVTNLNRILPYNGQQVFYRLERHGTNIVNE